MKGQKGGGMIVVHLMWLWISFNELCSAAKLKASPLKRVTSTDRVANLTRQHGGDVFEAYDFSECNTDSCIGLSSGTAALVKGYIKEIDMSAKSDLMNCKCQCLPHLSTYREDVGICVDDIHECTLAPFVSGSSMEKIPFVFLPLRGQIIHPSREINFPGIFNPICAVTGSQFLTKTGWTELRNPIDTDVPFRLFLDEGRTFLQWVGEADLRYRMQGRLILVHLLCRDMTPPDNGASFPQAPANGSNSSSISGSSSSGGVASVDDDLLPNQNIFTPCVAFRVVGTPIKHVNNVTEVSFQSESSTSSNSEGLSTREYVVIGLCSLLLGLIYVASVFLYLHMKKRKSRSPRSSVSGGHTMKNNELNFPPNDQVTYGPGFHRNGSSSLYGSKSYSPRNQGNNMRNVTSGNLVGEEMGVIKSNPLLKHFPNLSDNSGFVSDQSNSNSEFDDDHTHIDIDNKTQATVHPGSGRTSPKSRDSPNAENSSGNQDTERIPEENVSIVEDMTAEDKLENMKAIVNGTIRRKLYFNPAYFEPELLVSPPPAALEFLHKIREVITIAKFKMATKKFQPILEVLPEELQAGSEIYYGRSAPPSSRRSSVIGGTKSDTSRKRACSGCPGCETASVSSAKQRPLSLPPPVPDDGNCKNCGDKRNSIRKWLEGVSPGVTEDNPSVSDTEKKQSDSEGQKTPKTSELLRKNLKLTSDSSSSSDSDTIKANSIKSTKRKAPPIPTNPPRVISRPTRMEAIPKDSPKAQLYNKIAKSEIYNNPQFMQSSPELPPKNPHSSRQMGRRKQHIEVMDQYCNVPILNAQTRKQEMLKNMPDMVYEALSKDYRIKTQTIESPFGTLKLPTPDYTDEDYQGHVFKRPGEPPSVPTPDYNTLGRNRNRNIPPGSPIYARKSPHYVIVDYETDSLERAPCKVRKNFSSPSSSNSSSDSQPSPSLSAALPLEEEVEMRNAVYDQVEGFRKDNTIGNVKKNKGKIDYSLVSEVYVGNMGFANRSKRECPKIKYNVPYAGSMTIELDPSPDEYDVSTDSDQFEPDTLDRKPKKNQPIQNANIRAWNNHLDKATEFLNGTDNKVNYASLENMTSLPDLNHMQQRQNKLILRTSGSFKCDSLGQMSDVGNVMHGMKTFGSLREIYEAKTQKNMQRPPLTNIDFMDKGRILTLEERHSKRQRAMTESSLNRKNKPLPPDVIPYNSHYDHPKPPIAVSPTHSMSKNLTVWNTDEFSRTADQDCHQEEGFERDTDTYETRSINSETTEFTGVSETLANSEFEHDRRILANNLEYPTTKEYTTINKLSKFYNDNNDYIAENDGCYINKMEGKPVDMLDAYMTIEEVKESEKMDDIKEESELDRIEVISTKSLSNSLKTNSSKQSTLKSNKFTSNLMHLQENLQAPKIFRVEINPESDAIKLAMEMRDRAKKSKDIKNAWKRFVSMATSKLRVGSPTKPDIKFNFVDDSIEGGVDRDEGISSLIDENMNENKTAVQDRVVQISPPQVGLKFDPDSGYMSADSNESKANNRKFYDRFNFKAIEDKINEASYIDIEECSESEAEHQYTVLHNDTNKITLEITDNTTIDGDDMMSYHQKNHSIVEVSHHNDDDTEHYSSGLSTSEEESDDDGDELCESGAESVETHSVFFKQMRQ
ncbi:uncharacterized protein DMENIID0001_133750 [Sergentomyia squamirostris]